MTTTVKNTAFEKIQEIKNNYPALTFDNQGYQYLNREIRESYKEQIKKIESILKNKFTGIVEFNNFKPRKDETFSIRCQCKYDASFTGVVYLDEKDFYSEIVEII